MRNTIFLLSILCFVTISTVAQSDSSKNKMAKVYLIRATGYNGSATNMRAIVDDETVCKIANNRYSIIYLSRGKHVFHATTFVKPKAKDKFNLEVPLEAGKTYYLRMIRKTRALTEDYYFEEITYNSASPYLEKLKEEKNCDR
jgi:hypothetical protein